MNYEIIGLLGTLFVMLSFTRKQITQIRIINAIGAVFFVIYGILINSLSTWVLNGAIIVIQIYNLIKKRSEMNGEC